MTQVTPRGIGLTVDLSATNPNARDVSAGAANAHVVVDGHIDLGSSTFPQVVVLPAGQTTKLAIPIFVAWTDLPALLQLAAERQSVPYSVDGTLALAGALLDVTVPFHIDGAVSHEQIVTAATQSLPAFPR